MKNSSTPAESAMRVAVECGCHLRIVVVDKGLRHHRRTNRLAGGAANRGEDLPGASSAQETGGEVEPMDSEVVENQMINFLKLRAANPTVVPMHSAMDAENLTDKIRSYRLAEIAKVGRPPSVLIHRQEYVLLVSQVCQMLSLVQI